MHLLAGKSAWMTELALELLRGVARHLPLHVHRLALVVSRPVAHDSTRLALPLGDNPSLLAPAVRVRPVPVVGLRLRVVPLVLLQLLQYCLLLFRQHIVLIAGADTFSADSQPRLLARCRSVTVVANDPACLRKVFCNAVFFAPSLPAASTLQTQFDL